MSDVRCVLQTYNRQCNFLTTANEPGPRPCMAPAAATGRSDRWCVAAVDIIQAPMSPPSHHLTFSQATASLNARQQACPFACWVHERALQEGALTPLVPVVRTGTLPQASHGFFTEQEVSHRCVDVALTSQNAVDLSFQDAPGNLPAVTATALVLASSLVAGNAPSGALGS